MDTIEERKTFYKCVATMFSLLCISLAIAAWAAAGCQAKHDEARFKALEKVTIEALKNGKTVSW
jgi:hypothetical protein